MNEFKESLKVDVIKSKKPLSNNQKKEQAKTHLTAQQFEELMRKINEEVWEK